ncbi:MAG: ABC transporter permease [Proteobacteria bacterium]|nr:ABC transporter permease [Pseudomonadota bacterium]
MKENEVLINRWLAEQIGAEAGSELTLSAYKLDDRGSLYEESWNVVVQAVVPMTKPYIGSDLTPAFPGMHDAQRCADWEPGVPIDLDRIGVQDELYWKKFKASPKIFLPLHKAQAIWSNRFGSLTAIRFQNGRHEAIASEILDHISPGQLGFLAYPLGREALKGVAESVDFKGLTMGLSLFIIVAALILSRQLFTFYLEQREDQFAILKSFGFSHRSIWTQFALEGLCCSIVAAVIGSIAGILFGGGIIVGFNTIWQGAVNSSQLEISFQWASLLIGAVSTVAVVMIALSHCIYSFINTSSRPMLNRESRTRRLNRKKLPIGATFFLVLAIPLIVWGLEAENRVAIFFGVGFLTLISSLYWSAWILAVLPIHTNRLSFVSLAWRNCIRSPQRSITVISTLALAVFLCLTVTANRKGMVGDPLRRSSGTGGFSLYVETALPVKGNRNSTATGEDNKLERLFAGKGFFPLPSVEGSEASCLNLNRVTRPHISGVDPKDLNGRFTFKKTLPGLDKNWKALNHDFKEPRVIPAVADMDVITWVLGKKLGDDLEYQSSTGEKFRLRLVAGLENSIFQGRVLISRDNFQRLFPDSSGYRLFLVDASPGKIKRMKSAVLQAFRLYGAHVEDTGQRLHRFNAVQNTYLAVFLALGVIGLVLGCFGLAVLIRRNFIERLQENTCLLAIGYSAENIKRMFFHEYFLLFVLALASGAMSALAALIPVLWSDLDTVPIMEMAIFTIVVLAFGVGSLTFATRKHITLDSKLLSQVEE